jgi:ferredoxin-NADP reductase
MKATLVDRKEVAESTSAFTIEVQGARLEFSAGQTCDLTLRDPSGSGEDEVHTFSIASPPFEPQLTFATRLTGSAFKRALVAPPLGSAIEIEGPFGSFMLHDDVERPTVFLAGGIGVTPFRSMLLTAFAEQRPAPLTLVCSNRNARGTPFLREMEQWANDVPNFRLVATLTAPDPSETWTHEAGRVDAGFLKLHLPDRRAIHYISGPKAFVAAAQVALGSLDVAPRDIRTEVFTGY